MFFGQIDQLEVGGKSLQVDVCCFGVVAHLGHDLAEFTDGRRAAAATRFGESADLLLQIEHRLPLLLDDRLPQKIA